MRGYMYVCVGVWASFPLLGKHSYLLSENPAGWQVLTTGYTVKVVPIRSKKQVLPLWCFPFQVFKAPPFHQTQKSCLVSAVLKN